MVSLLATKCLPAAKLLANLLLPGPARAAASTSSRRLLLLGARPFQTSTEFLDLYGGGFRRGWDSREDEEGLHLRFDMPGLRKQDVSVRVEQNALVIRGEGHDEGYGDDRPYGDDRTYGGRIELHPPEMYVVRGIKAQMSNGVLNLFVPKVRKEQRDDEFDVRVD